MPIARSIIIGAVTAAAIAGLTPMLKLGEWNGPINFAIPLLIITALGLALNGFVAKPRGRSRGFVAGLGFATPVAAVCFLIPRFDPNLSGHSHSGNHVQQLLLVGFVALAISPIVMISPDAEDNEDW